MKQAYTKDIFRTVKGSFKRFLALMAIVILGLTAFSGIVAVCQDVYIAADEFYDKQKLFDIRIMSTAGLLKEDINTLQKLPDVDQIEGAYEETADILIGHLKNTVSISQLSKKGLNLPYLIKGKLPTKKREVAVTRDYLKKAKKSIGDTLELEKGEADSVDPSKGSMLATTKYKITGVVIDPMNINNPDGVADVRDTKATDFHFVVSEKSFNAPVYSVIYMTFDELKELDCYSDEYIEKVQKQVEAIEKVGKRKLEDRENERWYVQDRTSISSYLGMDSDLQSIEIIGKAFPVLFLIIAILISLTTMTRMVEEERGLIGIYKALGYGNIRIGWKYIAYALLASIMGSILGNGMGFIALPKLLMPILEALYDIPNVRLHFDVFYGSFGTVLFVVSIVTATALVSYGELRKTPASLMRPKAPKPGSRILVERIQIIWKRLKFLNKVTARNLFRYKKRLIMTVVGIVGCTALVLVGFAIRDSVQKMLPNQYEHIYRYDVMAIGDGVNDEALLDILSHDKGVSDLIKVQIETVKVFNSSDETESIPMIVIPEGVQLEDYIYTEEVKGELVQVQDSGILLTRNIAKLLELSKGSKIHIQNQDLVQRKVKISYVVDNYLGNNIYISQKLYEELFGESNPNAAYIHLKEGREKGKQYAKTLEKNPNIATAISIEEQKENFSSNFSLINYVIYLLIILAAGLAFVVLFTLANTNISERVRELATIKVLGFYDREVHSYANKETLLLTVLGILFGLPVGYLLSAMLLMALKMPSLEFVLYVKPQSFLYAAFVSFSFTIIVNLITNKVLDKINMVEALKSVE